MLTLENGGQLSYLSAGIFKGQKPWIHQRRVIDSWEIIFMLDGEAALSEEGQPYLLRKGDILLLEPGLVHEGTRVSWPPPVFYWMHFSISTPQSIRFKQLNLAETVQADNLTFYFSQLLHTANSPHYTAASPDALTLLILEYLNVCARTRIDRSDRLISEITEYVRTNAPTGLTVEAVAARYGYNPDYLSALFRDKTSMGLKEYIARVRLNEAKSLLVSSSYSVKEIAAQLGFSSSQHFISFFKYHEGISPLKYKNRSSSTHHNIR